PRNCRFDINIRASLYFFWIAAAQPIKCPEHICCPANFWIAVDEFTYGLFVDERAGIKFHAFFPSFFAHLWVPKNNLSILACLRRGQGRLAYRRLKHQTARVVYVSAH